MTNHTAIQTHQCAHATQGLERNKLGDQAQQPGHSEKQITKKTSNHNDYEHGVTWRAIKNQDTNNQVVR
eukprot:704940-Amphidinium_carterae.2